MQCTPETSHPPHTPALMVKHQHVRRQCRRGVQLLKRHHLSTLYQRGLHLSPGRLHMLPCEKHQERVQPGKLILQLYQTRRQWAPHCCMLVSCGVLGIRVVLCVCRLGDAATFGLLHAGVDCSVEGSGGGRDWWWGGILLMNGGRLG